MPPSPLSHTFIDEERKIETYEKMRCQKAAGEKTDDCPGIRILCRQGMFAWMAMSWTDLVAADRVEEAPKAAMATECVPEMVSMMASLIFR